MTKGIFLQVKAPNRDSLSVEARSARLGGGIEAKVWGRAGLRVSGVELNHREAPYESGAA